MVTYPTPERILGRAVRIISSPLPDLASLRDCSVGQLESAPNARTWRASVLRVLRTEIILRSKDRYASCGRGKHAWLPCCAGEQRLILAVAVLSCRLPPGTGG